MHAPAKTSINTDFRLARAAHRIDPIGFWLGVLALLVLAMVVVGGATRLTGSGLSITQWDPIMGAIPPLSDDAWQAAFAKYQAIPQYRERNAGMALASFKAIYAWEYGHRLLGRVVGLAVAVPLVVFWWRGLLSAGLLVRFGALLALGALQGFIGWYMVQSGLQNRVDVSPYRLALHLTGAATIFAGLVWMALERRSTVHVALPWAQRWLAASLPFVVLSQMALGAFVAGTHAALTYNTWPLMDGHIVPSGLWTLVPWWRNLVETIPTVQLDHRLMAYIVIALATWHAASLVWTRQPAVIVRTAAVLAIACFAQAGLGIATLLSVTGTIPIGLALAHQLMAFLVLGLAVWHAKRAAFA